MNNKKAIVLHSGGQDSTTCLFWALGKFEKVKALCIKYGQRNLLEVEAAKKIAEKANIPIKILDIPIIGQLTTNSLTNNNIVMDKKISTNSYPNTFVPFRNMFFLNFAATIAYSFGIRNIVIGISQIDYNSYPDCKDTFIRSLNATLNLAVNSQFIIHTPLMWFSKVEIWELAKKLNIFEIIRNETLTCYNGIIASGCGHCLACELRNKGLQKFIEKNKQN